MELSKSQKVSECPNAFVWKGADGIIYIKNKLDIDIELETHKESFKMIEELSEGQKCVVIVDMVGIRTMSKGARDYSRAAEHQGSILSAALLINNPVARILGNFFTGINKPDYPVKLFTNLDKARKWSMKQYKAAHVQ